MKQKIVLLLAGALLACSSVGFCAGTAHDYPSTTTKHVVKAEPATTATVALVSVNAEIAYLQAVEKSDPVKVPKSLLMGSVLLGAATLFQLKNPPDKVSAMLNTGDEDVLEGWMKEVSGLPNAPQLQWSGEDDTANISLNADGTGTVTNVKQNDAYIVWDAINKVFVVTDAASFTAEYEPVPATA